MTLSLSCVLIPFVRKKKQNINQIQKNLHKVLKKEKKNQYKYNYHEVSADSPWLATLSNSSFLPFMNLSATLG